jgi:transcriptional regulator with XRE-family HTH domain
MTQTNNELRFPQWDLADRLAKALRVSGVGASEMAEHLGVHRNTVGGYLHGHHVPMRAALIVWALRTGVPLEWLTGQQPAPHPVGPVEGLADECAVRELNPQPAD